jgi:hypothetical protein
MKAKDEDIKEFYDTHIYQTGKRPFEDLNEEEKKSISSIFAFRSFMLNKAGSELVATIVSEFKKLRLIFKLRK